MSHPVLLAPHNDDETLFAAFTCLRVRPLIVVCYRSVQQDRWGVTAEERVRETEKAAWILGCRSKQLDHPDDGDAMAPAEDIHELASYASLLIAPMPYPGGNAQHNAVGEIAVHASRVCEIPIMRYDTYEPNDGAPIKGRFGREVVPEPWMIERKLRALACYQSQHRIESGSRVHFMEDLREYLA